MVMHELRCANFDKHLPRLPPGALGSSTCLLSRTWVSLSVPIDSPHDEKDESRYGACDDGGTGGDGRGGSSGGATG